MKKQVQIALIAVIFSVLFISLASAELASINSITINRASIDNPIFVQQGENLEVLTKFLAVDDANDIELTSILNGNNGLSIIGTTERFDIINGTIYSRQTTLLFPQNANSGDYNLTLIIENGDETQSQTYPIKIMITSTPSEGSFCSNGAIGDLKIVDVSINNIDGTSDDEWTLFNNIEIEMEVENTALNDINEVYAEIGFFDSKGHNAIDDFEFFNDGKEIIYLGKLMDGEREKALFNLRVPFDFEVGDYKLKVKAYSEDLGEKFSCTDENNDLDGQTYQTIEIDVENDEDKFIQLDNLKIDPQILTCGQEIIAATKVVNVGDEDQNQIKIVISNAQLGIHESYLISSGLDSGDSMIMSHKFTVPEGVSNGEFDLLFEVYYDYRNGNYREKSDLNYTRSIEISECIEEPSLEERVAELEKRVEELENRTSTLEKAVKELKGDFEDFVKKIKNFIKNLPKGLSKNFK